MKEFKYALTDKSALPKSAIDLFMKANSELVQNLTAKKMQDSLRTIQQQAHKGLIDNYIQ